MAYNNIYKIILIIIITYFLILEIEINQVIIINTPYMKKNKYNNKIDLYPKIIILK